MKRSEINAVIRDMEKLIRKHGIELPPFCCWSPEEWETKGHEYDEIRDNMLGWDITDYGLGDFDKVGFALITIRNGNLKNPKYTKTYAEKLLMIKAVEGSLFNKQGNFPSHGFDEVEPEVARSMFPDFDFSLERLLIHRHDHFVRGCSEEDVVLCKWNH